MSKLRKNRSRPLKSLSRMILDWDEDHPGEHDATMEVDHETWADLVDLAGQVDEEENES